jgi:hypothetical protein
MTAPSPQPRDRRQAFDAARSAARRQTFTLARDNGAQTMTRPAFRGSHTDVRDVEPLAGMQAARDLEIGARQIAHDYIRAAREAGHTWHDIGTALGLHPNADAQQAGDTIADAAYTYAAGHPDTEHARRYGRTFAWHCPTCDKTIIDHGLCNGPADDEHGHTPDCQRHAATIASWNAEWDAIEADWEAGR